ncbi:type II secretion system protein N [Zestomonas carbonaria]|uniref:Type II secretion system protein N n=1 Tax=Zestomonas carbonaria TaxID=2762745 RepID=A0A7U7ERL1_9GAMM|nr:type II secretion system protein N [Pseudomonas carbonaria]CAD5109756.1 Type II secretion system protein N [Pseudomonas carbonaria]
MANLASQLWLQRHVPILLGALLVIAMSVGLAWQTADWIRLLRTPPAVQGAAPSSALSTPALERLETLFGPARSSSDSAPPSTNLRLTLRGSFVNADPQRSSAIVQRDSGKPKRFAVGEEIDSGVRLHAVYRDRIELDRNGRLETLTFPAPTSRTVNNLDYPAPDSIQDSATDDLSALQEEDAALLRERLEALRQQMEAAGTLPAEENVDETPPEPSTEEN